MKPEEIKKAGKWLSEQKYQTEQGDQEYLMYFDIDIPKMLVKYTEAFQSTIDQQKAEIKELSDVSDHLKEMCDGYESQLTEANQRGEKLKGVARNVLKEATKVYCHYNEIIKNKNESMDFKTLKELDAAISEYESTKIK